MPLQKSSSSQCLKIAGRMLAFGVCLAGLGACASIAPNTATTAVSFDQESALAAVNSFRRQHGLQPLAIDPVLTQVAGDQSAAMAARDRMDHGVAGALSRRMKRAGYAWSTTAENIGHSYPTYAAAEAGWERSPGHRANLLNPAVTEVGFGAARHRKIGRNYWTQIFAAPKQATRTVILR
ncbi:hypothetical protein Sa4125_07540 [Aureimonas sp. SA4125]|uniref:CAP domain-containing protein n=1 Tax=Aureimonas sp. SA4125 TaxID=2826993 RepID=UPI001CC420D6|nr:CAP domain-containing protein [Aureimonas sp. SA4125]BDA83212.1 hypothetical protein Sa4125_07540 [Aureimonas sp. SA4125]